MKIGLYTLHSSNNVGAMLQAYASTRILSDLGAKVEIVNIYTREEELRNHHKAHTSLIRSIFRTIYTTLHPGIKEMESHFDSFHSSLPLSKRYYSQEEYMLSPQDYDIHLVGSDQVWNLANGYDKTHFFFLDFLPEDSLRMSLASSFGSTSLVKDKFIAGRALNKFKTISVREDTAVNLVREISDHSCKQVLDPTLLLTPCQWDGLIDDEPIIKGKYIFYYGVNSDPNTREIIRAAKSHLGVSVVGYPGPLPPQYKFDKYIYNGGPKEFINLIKNATLVITSSFHGLAFALNYGKKFMIVRFGNRMERMESLLRVVNATDCVIDNADMAKRYLIKDQSPDIYSNILLESRTLSIKWIKNNIMDYKLP